MGFKNHFGEQYAYSCLSPLPLCSFPLFLFVWVTWEHCLPWEVLFLTEAACSVSLLGKSYCMSFLAASYGMGDLSSLREDQTCVSSRGSVEF